VAGCLEAGQEEEAAVVAGLSAAGPAAVLAAGGVVWRRTADGDGEPEVLLVHRPKYDDWTLPKGKLEPGETGPAAALREVEEETGLHCRLGAELPGSTYEDHRGRPKEVRYWAMQPESGDFEPNHEVDEVRWLPVSRAAEVLSYPRDKVVVAALSP
jgi:8-oxo-dGTP diphosphatase